MPVQMQLSRIIISEINEQQVIYLKEVEGVSQVFFTMGETDFIGIAHLPDSDAVGALLRGFEDTPEVERTNATYVIDTLKDDPRGVGSYSLETLFEVLIDDE